MRDILGIDLNPGDSVLYTKNNSYCMFLGKYIKDQNDEYVLIETVSKRIIHRRADSIVNIEPLKLQAAEFFI